MTTRNRTIRNLNHSTRKNLSKPTTSFGRHRQGSWQ
nr:MAG TPA: hypothetical protein [Caudoviricetes sp.]